MKSDPLARDRSRAATARERFLKKSLSVLLSCSCCWAQAPSISSEKPTGSIFIRPYKPANIPPPHLTNAARIQSLIRGGKLYLTAQDAIALTLENNLDLESDRYNALIDQWNIERAEAGGPLPGLPSGTSQAGTVISGEGAAGAQSATGINIAGGNNSTSNSVGASITQIGPVTPTLDPTFQSTESFSHRSTPVSNSTLQGVTNWIENTRGYNESISQGLITGGTVSLSFRNSYLNENVPSDLLNPQNAALVSLTFRHNLLSGFGITVNSRNITVARIAGNVNDLNFKSAVIGAVVNTLNLYYGLVADYEDLKAKQSALDVAQRFYEDTKKQVQIGTMAPLDVTTAEAQVASSQQDLAASQTTLQEQEISLKNTLSRTGLADPLLREVQIIPLDRIEVPEKDEFPPMKNLVATALANRPDIAAEKLNLKSTKTANLGTENGILPTLDVLATIQQQGLSGTRQGDPIPSSERAQILSSGANIPPGFGPCPATRGGPSVLCELPDPYFVGGLTNALGQMIRRNFPSQSVGGFVAPTLRNRQAQADYAIGELGLRQQQLQNAKDINEIAVDVSNQVIGLRQARARYQAAVHNRILEQQLLAAEQKKFSLGASTTYLVVQQQRDLATAQSAEVAALVAYSEARIGLNQTLGTTLQVNHVSIAEAVTGHVARPSAIPANLPSAPLLPR
jgi:outer membrane protein